MSGNGNEDDEPVGYCRPPRHSRFKPGQSGNRKRRPKGVRNAKTEALAVLGLKVKVRENGKTKHIPTLRALFLRQREKALNGDPKAMDMLLRYAGDGENARLAAETMAVLSEEDRAILAAYGGRHGKQEGTDGELL